MVGVVWVENSRFVGSALFPVLGSGLLEFCFGFGVEADIRLPIDVLEGDSLFGLGGLKLLFGFEGVIEVGFAGGRVVKAVPDFRSHTRRMYRKLIFLILKINRIICIVIRMSKIMNTS